METEDPVRLFVALRPPDALAREIREIQARLRETLEIALYEKDAHPSRREAPRSRVRWTPPEQLHVTLLFSAAFPVARIPALEKTISTTAAAVPCTNVAFAKPHTRPARGKPKIIWTPVSSGAEPLRQLHALLQIQLDQLQPTPASSPKKNFLPHLTLARVGRGANHAAALAIRQAVDDSPSPHLTWTPTEIELVQSTLENHGARHSVLRRFSLAPTPPSDQPEPTP